ncbi:MAG: phytoene desaturase, partial [Burkholderiaceae bacterium]|nr:phytoene desaturase [Burkholderiaceae bacterium]
ADETMDHLRLWTDPQQLAAAVQQFSPHDAGALPRFMRDSRKKLAAFEPVLARPFGSVAAFLDFEVLSALRHLRPWATIDAELARYFDDPRLRLAFSFQSKYLGMSPYRCPSLFTILSFLEHEHGVWHPLGGCSAVMEKMAQLATEMGVEIKLNQPVREIQFEGRRAVGVRTDERDYRTDAVVMNADFAHAARTLIPERLRRRWTNDKIESKRYSCSTFMLYLGIEGDIDLDHHTIVLAHDYAENLREIESGDAPPVAPSLYVHNPARTDPTLAPKGHSALYVLVPVGNLDRGVDWAAERGRYRALILRRLEALGIKDIERRIRVEKVMTPLEWESDLAVFRGATFNLTHSLDQMLCWRPRNRFEDVDGVYLVGGGTHPGSGLPVIFEGARITSKLIAEDLGFRLPSVEKTEPRDKRRSLHDVLEPVA